MLDPGGSDEAMRASVADLVRQTAEDGRAAIEAEIGAYKATAAFRLSGVKLGVPLIIGAVFVLQAVLTALFVGVIFSLAPLTGPGWATLIVTAAGLGLVGLVAWIGWRKLGSLFAPIPPAEPQP